MGSTKRQYYSEKQIELSNICRAFGHPARITIIELLLEYQNLNCNHLRAFIPLSQSTISSHLMTLFENGIIGAHVVNNKTYYEVNPGVIKSLKAHLDLMLNFPNKSKIGIEPVYFKSRLHVEL